MTSESICAYIKEEFQNLKQSSPILQSLIESDSYGLALITAEGRVIETNRRMREWFPGAADTASVLCHEVFFCRSHERCPDCPALICFQKREKHTTVLEHRCDREKVFYKVTCTPLEGPDGSIWGVLELVDDISAKVAGEQELSALEARFALLVENSSDVFVTFRNNGEILHANRKAMDLFGYTAEELAGKSIFDLIPQHRREQQMQRLQDIVVNRVDLDLSRVLEGEVIKKDGTTIPIEVTYTFHRTSKRDTITAIIRDVSRHKTYEREMQTYARQLEQEVAVRTRQLADSEERYRTLVETANEAIISAGPDGSVIYFNTRAETIFGYTREEILNQSIAVIIPEGIFTLEGGYLQRLLENAPGRPLENIGVKKDGSTFPIEYTVSTLVKEGARTITLVGRDITVRKKLEQDLQDYTSRLEARVRDRTYELTASQQKLKEKVSELSILKEISEVLSSTTDLDAVINIILVGATSHHGLGFNRAFLFLINDESAMLEGVVAIGPSDSAEAQKIWSEIIGKKLTLKEILRSYTNKSGKIDTHVNNIIQNIKIPLCERDNILIQAITTKQSFNIKDARNQTNIPNDLITLMNCRSFALMPLVAEGNVLGVLWADNAITKNEIQENDIERLRAFATNASLAIEKTNLYKNIRAKVVALDRVNKELQENRDRLIRSEKLAAVGEMSATVAHGIRNPLVAIGGFARRLLKKEDADSTNRRYLQIIVEEIDRLETILSELLDFVRPKKLELQTVCLHTIIEETLDVFCLELDSRNIRISRQLDQDLPPIELDSRQFKRVLQNLFNNAMDAMPEGGVLEIATSLQKPWIKVSIADTGIGISDTDEEKVFYPFFTNKPTGSGLGLAVCNQIMAIHGGHIKLRRQIPHGVVFDIFLPAAHA